MLFCYIVWVIFMKHFLIDYENIKADGIKNISDVNKDDVFYIFYSEQSSCNRKSRRLYPMQLQRRKGVKCWKGI